LERHAFSVRCESAETKVVQFLQSPINQGHAQTEFLYLENHAGHAFSKESENRLDSKPKLQGGSPQRSQSAWLQEVELVAPSRLVEERGGLEVSASAS
jgi:hypothetical protein